MTLPLECDCSTCVRRAQWWTALWTMLVALACLAMALALACGGPEPQPKPDCTPEPVLEPQRLPAPRKPGLPAAGTGRRVAAGDLLGRRTPPR